MIPDGVLRDSVSGTVHRMYENGVAVGSGGGGTNTDRASNQLVQFFLRAFFANHPALLPRAPRRATGFLLDGKVGEQTVSGILAFQRYFRNDGYPIAVDGRVSVAAGDMIPGARSRWTIHVLNLYYKEHARTKADFPHLWLNPEIQAEAPELAAELMSKQAR